jgi:hypothetical protein
MQPASYCNYISVCASPAVDAIAENTETKNHGHDKAGDDECVEGPIEASALSQVVPDVPIRQVAKWRRPLGIQNLPLCRLSILHTYQYLCIFCLHLTITHIYD